MKSVSTIVYEHRLLRIQNSFRVGDYRYSVQDLAHTLKLLERSRQLDARHVTRSVNTEIYDQKPSLMDKIRNPVADTFIYDNMAVYIR